MVKIFTARALVRYRDKYLLLKKAKDSYFPKNVGKWECPGETVEDGETSKDAIMRGIKEETGLVCKILKQLPTIHITDGEVDSTCDVYLLEATGNVRLSDEHSDFSWVSAEHVRDFPLVKYANLLLRYFNNPEKYLSR